jgi:hypothetical protein
VRVASSHGSFDGGLTIVVNGELQVLGVLHFFIVVVSGDRELGGMYPWFVAEPPFPDGEIVFVILRWLLGACLGLGFLLWWRGAAVDYGGDWLAGQWWR